MTSRAAPTGAQPYAAVLADESGNLYGTTAGGGLYDSGTVFRLDAANNYVLSTLHDFGGPDGASPQASLIADASGNLYGTTSRRPRRLRHGLQAPTPRNGIRYPDDPPRFGGPDGARPVAELIADASGNLYGTTSEGGPANRGTVFKLEAANGYALTTLHDFGGPDGATRSLRSSPMPPATSTERPGRAAPRIIPARPSGSRPPRATR